MSERFIPTTDQALGAVTEWCIFHPYLNIVRPARDEAVA
jgi:hypothetical protein